MARITVEDCLKKINNRFALIHMAAKRVRQLRRGADPLVVSKNRDVVIALREIAAGEVLEADAQEQDRLIENTVEILSQSQEGKTEEEAPTEKKEEEPAA